MFRPGARPAGGPTGSAKLFRMRIVASVASAILVLVFSVRPAGAQTFDAVGIRAAGVRPIAAAAGGPMVAAETLLTHHTGVTLVQSLVPGLAVGATLKLVRGFAGSALAPASAEDSLLKDDINHSRGNTRFDAD